jgi:DNA polymerase
MPSVSAIRELLEFYAEAGVDMAIGEVAVDRFAGETPPGPAAAPRARAAATAPVPRTPVPRAPQPTLPPTPDAAALDARNAVAGVRTLDDLRAALERFEGCALRATATRLVFADGNPDARLMLVGEAPGRDEDIEGLPFVGRSGKLLDRMLAAIGLDRTQVYIANVIPWRPPGNRTPTPQETQICLPFTRKQIELVDPDVLVCLGGPSATTLLGTRDGITKTRGRWFPYDTGKRQIRAMPTFHPAFLLRSPLQKRLVWRDFLAIQKALVN